MSIVAALLVFSFLLLLTGLMVGVSVAMPWLILAVAIAAGVRCGRMLDTRYNKKALSAILPTLFIAMPVLWGWASYKEFEFLCKSPAPSEPSLKSPRPQSGFLLDDMGLHAFQTGKFIRTPERLLEQKQIAYYDEIFSTADNNFQPKAYRRSKVSNSNLAEPASEFTFKVSKIERISSRWQGPIYQLAYSVESVRGSSVLAKKTEYVFGGGIVGLYLHALLGERGDRSERDFSHLSCGYASSAPAAWRPWFTTNPNSENYFKADIGLLNSLVY